jgi:hypothetical protein
MISVGRGTSDTDKVCWSESTDKTSKLLGRDIQYIIHK